jgi:signal transduction histidine kinase
MLATAGHDLLPRVMTGHHYTSALKFFTSATWLFSVIALGCLYRRRRSSALDLWLSVVMCAWVLDVALSAVLNHGRFDLGFYAGRVYGLIAASFVLITLLVESSYLYAKVQRSQVQLAQAQKMEAIGQLTGGIAHDFNNVLCAIQCGIEMVERRADPVEHGKLLRQLGPVKRAVENGTVLTRGLLAFSRRQALEPKNININRLVAGMSELLDRTLGTRVETRLAAPLSCCFVDPNQLENALLNLAVNARDAMPDGGTLAIQTEAVDLDEHDAASHGVPAGQYVVVSVSDTGTGMSPEALKRAFEPFFTTKSADRGTGLGLSQVYGFVNQSGGHVRIVSKLGHGTIVRMFLPAVSQQEIVEEDLNVERPSLEHQLSQHRPSRIIRPAESKAPARIPIRHAAEPIERIGGLSAVFDAGND